MPRSRLSVVRVELLAETVAFAQRAAEIADEAAARAVRDRGVFTLAVSGGTTPIPFLNALAQRDWPWDRVHVYQVDERIAPDGDTSRNLTALAAHLLDRVLIPPRNVHAMPVLARDPGRAALDYEASIVSHAGAPPVLDLVHLGIGADGHTASLVPGDPALDVRDQDVAETGEYAGWRRMTLTFPVINRAREILWLVGEAGKRAAVQQLIDGDTGIPAGRVARERATLLVHAAHPSELVVGP